MAETVAVRVRHGVDGETDPEHWHDRLADRFGYPRLSCQVRVEAPMTVARQAGVGRPGELAQAVCPPPPKRRQ